VEKGAFQHWYSGLFVKGKEGPEISRKANRKKKSTTSYSPLEEGINGTEWSTGARKRTVWHSLRGAKNYFQTEKREGEGRAKETHTYWEREKF